MDEVTAMSRAGEVVGRAMGTGLHRARVTAERVGRTGVEASRRVASRMTELAEQRLAEQRASDRKSSPQNLQTALVETASRFRSDLDRTREDVGKRSRKARKELARTSRQLARTAKRTRREMSRETKESGRQRRRWPLMLVLVAALAGAVAYVLSRRPQEVMLQDDEGRADALLRSEELPPEDNAVPESRDGRIVEQEGTRVPSPGSQQPRRQD